MTRNQFEPIQLPARRSHYPFRLRHYEPPEHAVFGATKRALWIISLTGSLPSE